MAVKSPPSVSDLCGVVVANRQAALDLSARTGEQRLRQILARAQAALVQRLHQAQGLTGPGKDSFTARQLEITLRQVRDLLRLSTTQIRELLLSQGKTVADLSTKHLVDYMQAANKHFAGISASPLPLREAAMLDRVGQGVQASILNRIATSGDAVSGAEPSTHPGKLGVLQRYGVATIESFQDTLQAGMISRKPWSMIRDEITAQSPFLQGKPASWAECIVRTETMGAYNRAGWEAVRQADETLGDVARILSATFDERTGWDSYQVHGQIRRSTEAFQWQGGFYQHPPNRPNDREVILPHRVSWPIPPYLAWKSDGEVMARYRMQRKTGSPGPRPPMTTIPLDRFGQK
jgi:hypothetical protein